MALTTAAFTIAGGKLMQASGAVPDADTWAIGSNVSTNGNHAMMSFTNAAWATLAASDDGVVIDATLTVYVATAGTPACAFYLWGSIFETEATPAAADYGKPANTDVPLTNDDYRVKIHEIFASGVAVTLNQAVTIKVPGMLFAGQSHVELEIRPDVVGVPGATEVVTIHSTTTSTTQYRPALSVTYSTKANYVDPEGGASYDLTGSNSYMAIGVETVPGEPVKPNIILEAIDMSMTAVPQKIASPARNRSRIAPSRMAPGRIRVSGGASIVVTPEKMWPLLLTQMKLVSTTDEGTIGGVQVYEHTFEVAQAEDTKTLTVLIRRGNQYEIYTGCRVGNMSFAMPQDEPVTMQFDMFAKACFVYDESSAGGEDLPFILGSTAAEDDDDNSFYTFIHAYLQIDGSEVESSNIRNVSLGLGQNIYEKTGYSRRREVQGHGVGGTSASIDVERYFQNSAELFKAFGHEKWGFPFAGQKNLIQEEYKVLLESPRYNGFGTQIQSVVFNFPRVEFGAVLPDNPRDGFIMITQQGSALKDDGINTNFQIILRNSEPASTFAPLTDYITCLPYRE